MYRPLPIALFALATLSPLLLIALSAWAGGGWAALAFLWMGFAAISLDFLLPFTVPDAPEGAEFPGSEALLVALGATALALLPGLAWAIGRQGFGPAQLCLILAGGLWLGQIAHPAAHELIHRGPRLPRALGVAVYTALIFGHHASAHRLVHHVHVGTARDPNTAPAGQSFWRFLPRAWVGSWRAGRAAERARGRRAYAIYTLGALAALALAAALGGLAGLVAWFLLAAHAQLQILLSDYVQHYGLTRARRADGGPAPVGPGQSWNTGHWASAAQTLNATRHSDHHMHPARPYPTLTLPEAAPRLPWPLPVAAAVALVPPLWRRRMRPLLPLQDS